MSDYKSQERDFDFLSPQHSQLLLIHYDYEDNQPRITGDPLLTQRVFQAETQGQKAIYEVQGPKARKQASG